MRCRRTCTSPASFHAIPEDVPLCTGPSASPLEVYAAVDAKEKRVTFTEGKRRPAAPACSARKKIVTGKLALSKNNICIAQALNNDLKGCGVVRLSCLRPIMAPPYAAGLDRLRLALMDPLAAWGPPSPSSAALWPEDYEAKRQLLLQAEKQQLGSASWGIAGRAFLQQARRRKRSFRNCFGHLFLWSQIVVAALVTTVFFVCALQTP
ncbi:hypothetical protein Esti_004503 [Eimeria stiedai]